MKVLIVASTFPRFRGDPTSMFVLEYAKHLSRMGNNVKVLAPHAPSAAKEENIDGVEVKRIQYMKPESGQTLAYGAGIPENMKSSWAKILFLLYLFASFRVLSKEIGKFKPDIVHAMWAFPQGFVASFLKIFKRFPLVISVFGAEVYLANRYHISWLVKFAMNRADALAANSSATINASRLCGVLKKMELIFVGTDLRKFKPDNDSSFIRKKYGLLGSSVILTVGRMVERKGQEYLVQAMPDVIKKYPNTRLMLVGGGPLEEKLRNRVKELGLTDSVVFAGKVSPEELIGCYAACDVFCLPAIVDSRGDTEGGQGLVTKEAMASQKPVTCTNVGGIPDLIKNEDTGLLVPPKDPGALAEAVMRLLGDVKLRRRIAKRGFDLVKNEASYETMVGKYLKIYKAIVK